jgi:cytidylate kinase
VPYEHRQDAGVLVVLISGPIASGKSALSRAVAAQLEEASGARGTIRLARPVGLTLFTQRCSR